MTLRLHQPLCLNCVWHADTPRVFSSPLLRHQSGLTVIPASPPMSFMYSRPIGRQGTEQPGHKVICLYWILKSMTGYREQVWFVPSRNRLGRRFYSVSVPLLILFVSYLTVVFESLYLQRYTKKHKLSKKKKQDDVRCMRQENMSCLADGETVICQHTLRHLRLVFTSSL